MKTIATKAIVWLDVAVIVVLVFLYGGIGREIGDSFFEQPGEDPTSLAVLTRVASEINKNMPMMVDQLTELMNVTVLPGIIVYNYKLNVTTYDEAPADILELRPDVLRQACSQPDTSDFLKTGVTMRYSYLDENRTFINSFDVTPDDCGF